MARRVWHVRLDARDCDELLACLSKLDAVHDSIKATGIAGKLAMCNHLVEVYRAIERVLKKEFAAVARARGVQPAPPPSDPQGEATTQDQPSLENPAEPAAVEA
jgi:hypothetical protein